MLSAYQKLLIFFPAILTPACDSSSLAFHMVYSACKLNKQGDNIVLIYSFPNLEPVHCSMSGSDYFFLTCIQISQEAGKVVWYSHLLKSFPQIVVIRTFKGFQFSSVTQLCPTLCDPMNCSMPGLPVHHQLPEFTQTHVH